MNDPNMQELAKALRENAKATVPVEGAGGAGGAGGYGGTNLRPPPSMVETAADEAPPTEMSIAQSVRQFSEHIASYIEREADRRLSAEKAYNENMHAFAASVRKNGIGA